MTAGRILLFAVLAILTLTVARAASAQNETRGPVLLAEVTGVIGPPVAHHIENAVKDAEARNAEALILEINTPGGLETSMRDIIETVLASRVPVIGYVSPSGGRAASAGAFILYATHVAAMAPGTNVGAATPVQLSGAGPAPEAGDENEEGQGQEQDAQAPTNADALERKAVNDAAAFIRSLASLRGRNGEWGERAVRYGEAISETEALELGVVEILAADLDDLLRQLDGRVVDARGAERTLATTGRAIERVEPSLVTEMLTILANPNVAFLLMLIGVYGLIYEFASPGSFGPGVVGAVCLVLGLYALNQLPLNYAGLALIALGLGLMIAEAFTPTFGVMGAGGAISFLIGAAMLIDTDIPEYRLSWGVIIAALAMTGGTIALGVGYTLRTHRRKVATGREALIGSRVEVLDWEGGSGHVWAASERWNAQGPQNLSPGAWVRVTAMQSLKLQVVGDDPPQGESA